MKFSENKNVDIKSRKIADSLVSDEFTYTGNMESTRELLGKETEKQGLRGSDLAELTGWSPSKTSKLTSGRQKLTAEDIRVWARALGYTPDPFVDNKVDIRYYKLSEYVRSAGETVKAYIKTKIGTPKHTAIARYELPLAILSVLGVTASDYAVRAKESYLDIVQSLNGGGGHTGTLIRFWQRTTSDDDGLMPEFCFCMSPSQEYILFAVYLNSKAEDGRIAELRRNCKETLKIEEQLTAWFDDQADSYKVWLPKMLRKGEIASIRLDIKDSLDTNKFEHDLIEIYEKYCDLIWKMKGMNLRSEKALQPIMNHVDLNMFGSLPLDMYRVTKDKKYLYLGLPYADSQWEVPANAKPKEKEWAEKGYSWQTRLWIDDMYMITIVQTHAYKVTKDRKYIDRAAKEMVMYLDELQRPNGLFYHAPDVPFYWGRGNGWMAAGMSELLRCLPKKHKDRARILEGYQKMMKSLKEYQNADGLWNQLIDKSDCWTESSGSAMFTFAFIMGVKNGWLDAEEYAPAARKAWLALVPYVNEKNQVREVCVGTNKKNDLQYYYDRPRRTGDYHGQGPVLWCTVALLEK